MALVAIANGQATDASQINQLINLLTGVMTDQPVTLLRNNADPPIRLGSGSPSTTDTVAQILFGYNGTTNYPHFITTRHNGATAASNQIKFWTSDGTQLGVFPTNAILALTLENGKATAPSDMTSTSGKIQALAGRVIAGADSGAGVAGDIIANRGGASPGSGAIFFGSSTGAHNIYFDGTNFNITDPIVVSGNIYGTPNNFLRLQDSSATPNKYIQNTGGQLGIANSAFSVWLLLLNDVGLLTLRNAINVPPSVGGTVATTNYGTVPVKIAEVALSVAAGNVTFSSIPAGFRNLRIVGIARSDSTLASAELKIRFNGDAAGNYNSHILGADGTTTVGPAQTINDIFGEAGMVPVSADLVNNFGVFEVLIPNYAGTTAFKGYEYRGGFFSAAGGRRREGDGEWASTAAINSVTLLASPGNLIAGTTITLYGEP